MPSTRRLRQLLRGREGPRLRRWLRSLPNGGDWDTWQDFWIQTRDGRVRRCCSICGLNNSAAGCIHDWILRHRFSPNRVQERLQVLEEGAINPALLLEKIRATEASQEIHNRVYDIMLLSQSMYCIATGAFEELRDERAFNRAYLAWFEQALGLEDNSSQIGEAVGTFLEHAIVTNFSTDDIPQWIENAMDKVPPEASDLPRKSVDEVGLTATDIGIAVMSRLGWAHVPGYSNRTGNPNLDRLLDSRVASNQQHRTHFWVPNERFKNVIFGAIETFHWFGACDFVVVSTIETELWVESPIGLEWTGQFAVYPVFHELC